MTHVNVLEMKAGLAAALGVLQDWRCGEGRLDIGRAVCPRAGTRVARFGSASFLGAVKLPHEQTCVTFFKHYAGDKATAAGAKLRGAILQGSLTPHIGKIVLAAHLVENSALLMLTPQK